MKKRFISAILFVSLLLSSLFISGFTVQTSALEWNFGDVVAYYSPVYLSNPGGSSVFAYRFDNYSSASAGATFENNQNTFIGNHFPNAKRFASATARYNCHSYAWASENLTNPNYWVNSPANYYKTGNNYYEVSTPQFGDIICYFDDNGTPNDTSDDINLHSGFVVKTGVQSSNNLCGNSNTVIVESKWGAAGVYRHNGYECPYTDYVVGLYSPTPEENERAEYVKYYRRSGHTHNFNIYTIIDSDLEYHECKCSCGRILRAEHVWTIVMNDPYSHVSPTYIPMSECTRCGMRALNP